MKAKKFILSFVFCLCAILPLFALAGCGSVTVSEVKTSFADLVEEYNSNAQVFAVGTLEDDFSTNYYVKYGLNFDSLETSENVKVKFDSLENKYNVMLAISSKYIDGNKDYVTALVQEDLSADTKSALKKLNKSLTNYVNYISTFVKERNEMKNHFEKFAGNEATDLAVLRDFKKSYGELVDRNITLALDLAEVVETTEIFDLLKSTEPTRKDTQIVKEYIAVKMLPIFNELLVRETETAFSYDDYQNDAKQKLEVAVSKLEDLFVDYKNNFVTSNKEDQALSGKEEMQKLFDDANNFFVEEDNYLLSVEKLEIYDLVVENKSFEEHEKQVKYAKVYFEKINQFVNITLGDYLDNLAKVIY